MACKVINPEIVERIRGTYNGMYGYSISSEVMNRILARLVEDAGSGISEGDLSRYDSDEGLRDEVNLYIMSNSINDGSVDVGVRHNGVLGGVRSVSANSAYQCSNAYIGYNVNNGISGNIDNARASGLSVNDEIVNDGNTVAYVNVEAYTDPERTIEAIRKVFAGGGKIVIRSTDSEFNRNTNAIKAWRAITEWLYKNGYGYSRSSRGFFIYGEGCPRAGVKVNDNGLNDDERKAIINEVSGDFSVSTTYNKKFVATGAAKGYATMWEAAKNGAISAVSVSSEQKGYVKPEVGGVIRLKNKNNIIYARVTSVDEYDANGYNTNAESIAQRIGLESKCVKSTGPRAVIGFTVLFSEENDVIGRATMEEKSSGGKNNGKKRKGGKKGYYRPYWEWYTDKNGKRRRRFRYRRSSRNIGDRKFLELMNETLKLIKELRAKGEDVDASGIVNESTGEVINPVEAEIDGETAAEVGYQRDRTLFGANENMSYIERINVLNDVFNGRLQLKREFVRGMAANFMYAMDGNIKTLVSKYSAKSNDESLSKSLRSLYAGYVADLEENGLKAAMRIPGAIDAMFKACVYNNIVDAKNLADRIQSDYKAYLDGDESKRLGDPGVTLELQDYAEKYNDENLDDPMIWAMTIQELRTGYASRILADPNAYRALIDAICVELSRRIGVKMRSVTLEGNAGLKKGEVEVAGRQNDMDNAMDEDVDGELEEQWKDGWMIKTNEVSTHSTLQAKIKQRIGTIFDLVREEKDGKVSWNYKENNNWGTVEFIEPGRVWATLLRNYHDVRRISELKERIDRDADIKGFGWLHHISVLLKKDEKFAAGLLSSLRKSHTNFRHFGITSSEVTSFGSNFGESSEAIMDMMRRNVQSGFNVGGYQMYTQSGLIIEDTPEMLDKVKKLRQTMDKIVAESQSLQSVMNKADVIVEILNGVGVEIDKNQLKIVFDDKLDNAKALCSRLSSMLSYIYKQKTDAEGNVIGQPDMFSYLNREYEDLAQILSRLGDDRIEQMVNEHGKTRYTFADPNMISSIAEIIGREQKEYDKFISDEYFMDGDGSTSFFNLPVFGRVKGWLTDMQDDRVLREIFRRDTHTIIGFTDVALDMVEYADFKRNDISIMALASFFSPKTMQNVALNSKRSLALAGADASMIYSNHKKGIKYAMYRLAIMADSKVMAYMPGLKYSMYNIGQYTERNTQNTFNKEEYFALREKYAYVALQEYYRIKTLLSQSGECDNLGDIYENNASTKFQFLDFLNDGKKADESVLEKIGDILSSDRLTKDEILNKVGSLVMRRLKNEVRETIMRYEKSGLFKSDRFRRLGLNDHGDQKSDKTFGTRMGKAATIAGFVNMLMESAGLAARRESISTETYAEYLNVLFDMTNFISKTGTVTKENYADAVKEFTDELNAGRVDIESINFLRDISSDTYGIEMNEEDTECDGYDMTSWYKRKSVARDRVFTKLGDILSAKDRYSSSVNGVIKNVHDVLVNNINNKSNDDDILMNPVVYALTEYIANMKYAQSQMMQIMTGDVSFFKNVEDFTKRNKEVYAAYKRPTLDAKWKGEYVLDEGMPEEVRKARAHLEGAADWEIASSKELQESQRIVRQWEIDREYDRELYLSDFKMTGVVSSKQRDVVAAEIAKHREYLKQTQEVKDGSRERVEVEDSKKKFDNQLGKEVYVWESKGYFNSSDLWNTVILPELLEAENAGEVTSEDIMEFYDSYTNFEASDGQSFRTIHSYVKLMKMMGAWDDKKEEDYQKILEGTADYNTIKLLCDTIKPYCFGYEVVNKFDSEGNVYKVKVPTQHKNSEFILMTMITSKAQYAGGNSVLAGLGRAMREHNIDVVHFNSVVKVGGFNAIDITHCKNGDEVEKEIRSVLSERAEAKKTNPLLHDYIHRIRWDRYGIQVSTREHHEDADIGIGTQILKLITADIPDTFAGYETKVKIRNYDGTIKKIAVTGPDGIEREIDLSLSKKEFVDLYRRILIANLKEDYENMLKQFDTPQKVVDMLRRQMKSSDRYSEDMMDYIAVDDNGEFVLPLDDITVLQEVESLFASVIRKGIVKQDVAGGTLIQATGVGLSSDLKCVTEYDKETGRRRIKYVECMAPAYMKAMYENYMDSEGNLDIRKMEQDAPEMLDMIGYRVPTEHLYSTVPLRIVGFTNKENSSAILLPQEIVVWSGSDFDVDKLYMMFPELKTVKDDSAWESAWKDVLQEAWEEAWSNHPDLLENAQNLRLGDIEAFVKEHETEFVELNDGTTQTVGSLFNGVVDNMKNNDFDKLFIPLLKLYKSITGKDLNDSLSDEDQKIMKKEVSEIMERIHREEYAPKTKLEYVAPDYSKRPEEQSRAQRNNMLLELMRARMTSDFAFLDMMRPGGFARQKRMSYITTIMNSLDTEGVIRELGLSISPTDKNAMTIIYDFLKKSSTKFLKDHAESVSSNDGIGFTSADMFEKFHVQNMVGAKSIGMYALQNSSHAVLQNSGISISDEFLNYFDICINGYHAKRLNDILDINGKSILRNIGGFLAASVDNAKDPILEKLHQNEMTINMTCALLRMGYSLETVMLLINTPTFRNFVKGCLDSDDYNKSKIRYMKEEFKYTPDKPSHEMTDEDFIRDTLTNKDGHDAQLSADIMSLLKGVFYVSNALGYALDATKIDVPKNSIQKTQAETITVQNKIKSFYANNSAGFYYMKVNEKGKMEPAWPEDEVPILSFDKSSFGYDRDLVSFTFNDGEKSVDDYMSSDAIALPHIQAWYDYGINLPVANILGRYMKTYSDDFVACYNLLNSYTKAPNFWKIKADMCEAFEREYVLYKTIKAFAKDGMTVSETRRKWLRSFPRHFEELIKENPEVLEKYTFLKNIHLVDNGKMDAKVTGENYKMIAFSLTGKMDKATRDVFTAEWESMANDENDDIANLARDLFTYSMFLNGCNYGRGVGYFAPKSMILQFSDYIDNLRNVDEPMSVEERANFVDQFVRNHLHSDLSGIVGELENFSILGNNANEPKYEGDVNGQLVAVKYEATVNGKKTDMYKWEPKESIYVKYKGKNAIRKFQRGLEPMVYMLVGSGKDSMLYRLNFEATKNVSDKTYAVYDRVDMLSSMYLEYDPDDTSLEHVKLDYSGELSRINIDVDEVQVNTGNMTFDELIASQPTDLKVDEKTYTFGGNVYKRVHNALGLEITNPTKNVEAGKLIGAALDEAMRYAVPIIARNIQEGRNAEEGVDWDNVYGKFYGFGRDSSGNFDESIRKSITSAVQSLGLQEDDEVYCDEILLWHKYDETGNVAGTIDMIIKHSDGTFTICDFKSISNFVHLEDNLNGSWKKQLSAYKSLFENMTGSEVRDMYILPIEIGRDATENNGALTVLLYNKNNRKDGTAYFEDKHEVTAIDPFSIMPYPKKMNRVEVKPKVQGFTNLDKVIKYTESIKELIKNEFLGTVTVEGVAYSDWESLYNSQFKSSFEEKVKNEENATNFIALISMLRNNLAKNLETQTGIDKNKFQKIIDEILDDSGKPIC